MHQFRLFTNRRKRSRPPVVPENLTCVAMQSYIAKSNIPARGTCNTILYMNIIFGFVRPDDAAYRCAPLPPFRVLVHINGLISLRRDFKFHFMRFHMFLWGVTFVAKRSLSHKGKYRFVHTLCLIPDRIVFCPVVIMLISNL